MKDIEFKFYLIINFKITLYKFLIINLFIVLIQHADNLLKS